MQQRVNGKAAKIGQKRDLQANIQRRTKPEESSAVRTQDPHPLENVSCRIGDSACAAKHVSVIQRTGLFHPMNEGQRVRSLLRLQRQYGNRFVQRVIARHALQTKLKIGQPGDPYEQEADRVADRVIEGGSFSSFSQSRPSAALGVHRDLEPTEAESPPKATTPISASKSRPRPIGIEKTEIVKQKLHFGARYVHTFKSSGGNLHGIHVTEKVRKGRDDFRTGLPNIELGKIKTRIDKKRSIADRIWISFGAIAPAVKRLRENREPGVSLLGRVVDHQELHYWDNGEPPGWKKFADVKIEQQLYDLPELFVVTLDNGVMANPEEFTPFRSRSEEKRQLLDIGSQTNQDSVGPGILQPKLGIGPSQDLYEQEADRVAEQVMRMPEPPVRRELEEEEEEEEELLQSKPFAGQITPLVQRQVEEEEEELQAKELPSQTPDVAPNLEAHINAIQGGGQTLPASTRAFFESRFGYDFSQVRVHTDNQAAQSAQALNAQAFTVGRDMVFGTGQYAPNTAEGRRLLAHELTHVV